MSHGTGRAMPRSHLASANAYDFAGLRKSIMIPSGVEDASLRTDGPFAYRDLDECIVLIQDYVDVVLRFGVRVQGQVEMSWAHVHAGSTPATRTIFCVREAGHSRQS